MDNGKERRKLQNKIAQRKYRGKIKQKTKLLEARVAALSSSSAVHSNRDEADQRNAGMRVVQSHTGLQEGSIVCDDQLSRPGESEATMFPIWNTATMANQPSMNPSALVEPTFGHNGAIDSSSSNSSNQPTLATNKPEVFAPYQHAYSNPSSAPVGFPNLPDFRRHSPQRALGPTSLPNYFHTISPLEFLAGIDGTNLSAKVVTTELLSYLHSDSEREAIAKIMAAENMSLRDIVKCGLVSLGSALGSSRNATGQPTNLLMAEIASACAPYGVPLVIWTGVRRLAQMIPPNLQLGRGSPTNYAQKSNSTGASFDVPRNPITLTFETFVSAGVANAQHLRISIADLMNECSESPLTSKTGAWADSRDHQLQLQAGEMAHPSPRRHYPDLDPTPVQLQIPHHPYLDVIPWPSFRSKAIVAGSLDPPLIDEDDLCLDLNSGIRCWGSLRSLHGRGEGTPWDKRSWEVMPWFLDKWRVLFDGDCEEISRNSAWWRAQQGMPS